jgi:hypothetical protein
VIKNGKLGTGLDCSSDSGCWWRNPIQNIDHEAKVIQIKRDARIEPSILRRIEQAAEELGIGYRVEQLT